jgi:hypothetical protein
MALVNRLLATEASCLARRVLTILWFVARLFSAALWPAMGKLARASFGPEGFARAWAVLCTSSRFGAVCAGMVLAPVLPTWVSILTI